WRYELTTGGVSACATPWSLAPVSEPVRAVAFPGRIGDAGMYIADSAVSFACETGVVAKCIGWGYAPAPLDTPLATLVADAGVRANALLACTRMARADYCATGDPHTIDGTPVHVYDVFGLRNSESRSGFSFEAAWPAVAKSSDSDPQ